MDNIWFDLYIGNIEVDEEGNNSRKVAFSRFSQISASDITSIAKYREMLHNQLDKAIDYIEKQQELTINS